MKTLIIGKGEVGQGLYDVLKRVHPVRIRDREEVKLKDVEILHICFPYFKEFEKEVKRYQKKYQPKYTIIHSTVPVGTSRQCQAFHSPVRGMHPNLTEGIKTFVKYLAPQNSFLKKYFELAGIKIQMFKKPETTELLKILDTTYYGWNIVFCKEVKRICDEQDLNFEEVYTLPNLSYNEGYEKLGLPLVRRPVLRPVLGKIGGHCITSNCSLLKDKLTKIILDFDRQYPKKIRKQSQK